MARVAVCSAAYLGDVAPYLAVARRLSERGHDVVAVLPEGFRDAVRGEPFAFHPYALDCSPPAIHADPEHDRLMRHPFRHANALARYWATAPSPTTSPRPRPRCGRASPVPTSC